MEQYQDQTFVEWVDVDLIDATLYGRPVSDPRVVKMVAESKDIDPKQVMYWLGIITLSLQDSGRYQCINGNHRVQVAKKLGLKKVRAEVLIDLTPEEEAKLFEIIHTQYLPSALDRFRARLYRKEETAKNIEAILQRHGLFVTTYKGPGADGAVQAVASLDQIYKDYGPLFLEEVISILHAAWGLQRRAYITNMLTGMAAFWVRFRQTASRARLIDVLKRVTPERIMAEAGGTSSMTARETPPVRFGKTFYRHYMFGLRQDSRSLVGEWIERPGSRYRDTRVSTTLKSDDYQTQREQQGKPRATWKDRAKPEGEEV